MGYYYNSQGKLVFSKAYVAPRTMTNTTSAQTRSTIKTDPIRPMSLYVESNHRVENGHLAQWTGSPAMFSASGQKISSFTAQTGHEFALSQVQACDTVHSKKVAGVVIEHAATPEDDTYVHKGVHSNHDLQDNQHIHRLATSGSVVLAWVLADNHENALDGVYTQYLNGVENGLYIVRELGQDYFTMERVGSNSSIDAVAQNVSILTARLDSLTSQ